MLRLATRHVRPATFKAAPKAAGRTATALRSAAATRLRSTQPSHSLRVSIEADRFFPNVQVKAPEPPQLTRNPNLDLLGLAAETTNGTLLGEVIGLHDFGAGELIELRPLTGPTLFLPFGGQGLVEIDLEGGRVVLDPPAEFLDPDNGADKA